jgi:hypothetical protein
MRTRPVSLCNLLDKALEIVPAPGERFFKTDVLYRDTDDLRREHRLLQLRLALAPRATNFATAWVRAREAAIRRELNARARRLKEGRL